MRGKVQKRMGEIFAHTLDGILGDLYIKENGEIGEAASLLTFFLSWGGISVKIDA